MDFGWTYTLNHLRIGWMAKRRISIQLAMDSVVMDDNLSLLRDPEYNKLG